MRKRRIAVIGAGPIGIEAALYGLHAGFDVKLYERGPLAANVSSWGHVRFFSTWAQNTTGLGLQVMDELALDPPDPDTCPLAHELVHLYLEPIARSPRLAGRTLTDTRVVRVSRESQTKLDNIGRPDDRRMTPFRLLVHDGAQARIEHTDVVIDASGTYGNAVGFGAGGMNPVDAPRFSSRIDRALNDVEGIAHDRYAGKHVMLVGSGYLAALQAVALDQLAAGSTGTRVTWITRDDDPRAARPIDGDSLTPRRVMMERANEIAADHLSSITHVRSAFVSALGENVRGALNVDLSHGDGSLSTIVDVDVIIALTGHRPDLDLDEELQVQRCYATEAPVHLARALVRAAGDGGSSFDGSQLTGLGPECLVNHEPDFYVLGAKSFGRNSSFLLQVGHRQIRDAFRQITGEDGLDLYSAT